MRVFDETGQGSVPLRPVLMGQKAAASYVGLSVDDFRHEVNQGRIHMHRRNTYRQSDLDEWKRNLPKILAGKYPDMDLSGVPRTQRAIERVRRMIAPAPRLP